MQCFMIFEEQICSLRPCTTLMHCLSGSSELSQCPTAGQTPTRPGRGSKQHYFGPVTPTHGFVFKTKQDTKLSAQCCQSLRNLQGAWSVHIGHRSSLNIQQNTSSSTVLYLGNFGAKIFKEAVSFVNYLCLKNSDKEM